MKKLWPVAICSAAVLTLAACAPNNASTGASNPNDPYATRDRSANPASANQGGQAGTQAPATSAAGSPGTQGTQGNPGPGANPHGGSGAQ